MRAVRGHVLFLAVAITIVAVGSAPAFSTSAPSARTPGAPIWVARHDDSHHHSDKAESLAVSPDGATVFVTGVSNREYGTVAYDSATGARKWVARFNGSGTLAGHDRACCVVASPDGQLVFVSGVVTRTPGGSDFGTVAYDAATGTQRWVSRYNDGKHRLDFATAMAVNPDGSRLYVAGYGRGAYRVIAYDPASGAELWVSARRSISGTPSSLAVSPDGTTVVAAGIETVAYDAVSGAVLWRRRPHSRYVSGAAAVAISPDSSKVFVTGDKRFGASRYLTVSYDARTGVRNWSRLYGTVENGGSVGLALAVSPDGSLVFVTGGSSGAGSNDDYATIAYDAVTGHVRWVERYNGPGNYADDAWAICVSPDGSEVYVTGGSTGGGTSLDYATIAYDATSGARRWLKRYNGPASYADFATAIGISPVGSRVFVTGWSSRSASDWDYATVAYAT